MPNRSISDIHNEPTRGDVVQIKEMRVDADGNAFEADVMVRVVAAHEGRVWIREYGAGHSIVSLSKWQRRFTSATLVASLERWTR